MSDGIRWVGLDVHARQSTVAVFDHGTGDVVTRRVVGRPHELLPVLREIPRPARVVYEAGPTDTDRWRAGLWLRGSSFRCAHRARPSVRRPIA